MTTVLHSSRTDIPRWLTTFVSRSEDMSALAALLDNPQIRLITILGPTGVGKSRLAGALTANLQHPNRFVRLHECRSIEQALATIARSLGLHNRGVGGIEDSIVTAISRNPFVLVLDGIEALDGLSQALAALLTRCLQLKVLVTSRRTLHLEGEYIYQLQPLSSDSARELFLDRVSGMGNVAFDQNAPEELAAINAICELLDGVPLSIELAAARTRVMSPSQLVLRLEEALAAGSSQEIADPVHFSRIRESIEETYQTLSTGERALLCDLSLLRGGFTLSQAEGIAALRNTSERGATDRSVQDLLTALVHASMVQHAAKAPRFQMIRAIREFGMEELVRIGGFDEARKRHMQYFAGILPASGYDALDGYVGLASTVPAEDIDNLLAALATALAIEDVDCAWRLAGGLGGYWWDNGQFAEAFTTFEQLINLVDRLEVADQSRIFGWCAEWAWLVGRRDITLDLANQALSISRAAGDRVGVAANLYRIARVLTMVDPAKAVALLNEALEIFTLERISRAVVWTQLGLGYAYLQLDQVDEARSSFEHALEQSGFVATHHLGGLSSSCMLGQAWFRYKTGNLESATRFCRRAFEDSVTHLNPYGQFGALFLIARVSQQRNNMVDATARYIDALRIALQLNHPGRSAQCLLGIASVASARGDFEQATIVLGIRDSFLQHALTPPSEDDTMLHATLSAQGKSVLGHDQYATLLTQGRQESWGLAASLIDGTTAPIQTPSLRVPLTRREIDVLSLLGTGSTNREIAARLFLSTRTVDTHVSSILTKLDVHSRHEALKRARELELIA